MTALFQVLGAVAIVVSLVGTWLAARRRARVAALRGFVGAMVPGPHPRKPVGSGV